MYDFRPLLKPKYLPYPIDVMRLDGKRDDYFLAVDDGTDGDGRWFKKFEGGSVQYPSGRYIFKIGEKIIDPSWIEKTKAPIFSPKQTEPDERKKDLFGAFAIAVISILIIAYILGCLIK